jgi:hypothetical protein
MSFRRRSARLLRGRSLIVLLALALVAAVTAAAGGAASSARHHGKIVAGSQSNFGIIDISRNVGRNSRIPVEMAKGKFKPLRTVLAQQRKLRRTGRRFHHGTPAAEGDARTWIALDDAAGFYRKQYVLKKLSSNTEIWVARDVLRSFAGYTSTGTEFQAGDCRNNRTTVTQGQIDYLANQFDTNILPKESALFSVAPDRDGTNGAHLAALAPDAPGDSTGAGNRTVVLVDNVRDDNFKDFDNTQANSYIAGFFSSGLNALLDRNIMTIDAFDWAHRTGADPPHEPVPGNNCTSAPARPFLYEGVFAHEYQHLLHSYVDPGERTWANEGLSDFAIDATGYDFPTRSVSQIGFDSHLQCFFGNLITQTDANPNPRGGGPENSLTSWQDQGPGEILCDYGAAFSFMEYLHGQYGTPFISALHTNPAHGLAGLQSVLGLGDSARAVVHRWAASMAIDAALDRGATLRKGDTDLYQTPALNASVNWDNPDAYSTPGAPPNGSDYVRARNAVGTYLNAKDVTSISFDGDSSLPTKPVEWVVDADPYGHEGNPALYSGIQDNADRMIIKSVAVSAASPTLTFDSQWNLEEDSGGPWDFGFVQISTDGGATYHSVACTDTRTDTNPGAIATVKNNVPGFSGDSNGWKPETCSLSAYAGQTVLLAFRYVTDSNTQGHPDANARGVPPGFWVDNVNVSGTSLSDGSTLTDWQSPTQVKPVPVSGYTVQVVAYSTADPSLDVPLGTLSLNSNFDASLSGGQLASVLGNDKHLDVVGLIVMYDEPTESINDYAPYTLKVNGVTQPGGS